MTKPLGSWAEGQEQARKYVRIARGSTSANVLLDAVEEARKSGSETLRGFCEAVDDLIHNLQNEPDTGAATVQQQLATLEDLVEHAGFVLENVANVGDEKGEDDAVFYTLSYSAKHGGALLGEALTTLAAVRTHRATGGEHV